MIYVMHITYKERLFLFLGKSCNFCELNSVYKSLLDRIKPQDDVENDCNNNIN